MTISPRPSPDLPARLPQNLKFVLGLSPSAMTLGLGNIRALLTRLGHPERRFPSVVVAGTNGKGSVTAMLSSILSSSGLLVGRYTSPHVYSATERVCVGGTQIDLDEMEWAASRVAPLREEIEFSYFEAITAIAFLVYAERGVDIAVLETGLGGRFDATNAVEPVLSIITSISLDHRRILGDSEEEILREKLGVTRPGTPLLTGHLSGPLEGIVRERSLRDGFPFIPLHELGHARIVAHNGGAPVARLSTSRRDYGDIQLPFAGEHQAGNALLSVGAAERLVEEMPEMPGALAGAYLPGRFERFDEAGRTFVLDVAHNEEALKAVALELRRSSDRGKNAVVLGLMRRKELFEAPAHLVASARRIYLVSTGSEAAFSPAELAASLFTNRLNNAGTDVILWCRQSESDDHWSRLWTHLHHPSNPCRTILVTGSHHVVEHFGKRLLAQGVGE